VHFGEHILTYLNGSRWYDRAISEGYKPVAEEKYAAYNRFRPDGAKRKFCYLPYTSMTFSFGGKVFVCGYNRDIQLGNYPEQTIMEIWNSPEAIRLRSHMDHNDLTYGCGHCHFFLEKGKFSNLRPLVFDKYYKNTDASRPLVFEFEMSNECNLECQMCIGEVSSSIRKNRDKLPPLPNPYDSRFVEQLIPFIPALKEAKFYGGEPFLISVYYEIWEQIQKLNPRLPLFTITNGTHWNAKIERLLNELNFDLAVSIDAVEKEKFERIRKNASYEKVMSNIRRFSEISSRKRKHLSLSFTVQQDNWEQLPGIIRLCDDMDAFIYVSYLERPEQFALSSLPKQKLIEIRNSFDGIVLPSGSSKAQHNRQCFADFLSYLDQYIDEGEESRYRDYHFIQASAEPELMPEAHEPSADPAGRIDAAAFENWLSLQENDPEALKHFRELLQLVISGLTEESKELVYFQIVSSGYLKVFQELMSEAPDNLRQKINVYLSAAN